MDNILAPTRFPGPPAFSLRIPAGWSPVPAPEVLVALVADGPEEAFRANVLVSTAEHEAPVELSAVAEGVRRRLTELPRAEVFGEKHLTVGDLPAHLIRVSYVHPAAGTLVQAVLTVPVPRGETEPVDVVDVVGTAAAHRIAEDVPAVDQIMRSVRLG